MWFLKLINYSTSFLVSYGTFAVLLPRFIRNSPYCLLYDLYDVSLENLVLD